MALTLTSLRLMVRNISDLDTTDLSNATLDDFAREGFQRIVALERRWPFYETTYTFNTVAGTRAYTIATVGDIREVTSVIDTSTGGNRLTMIAHDDAEGIWLGTTDARARPLFYTVWANQVHLYPKPDAVYAMSLRGYRKPLYTWLTTITTDIDADEWFHSLLAYFILARIYQRQEDPELSAMYMQSFEEGVAMARRDLMAPPSAQPMIMSGGKLQRSERRWLESLKGTLGS